MSSICLIHSIPQGPGIAASLLMAGLFGGFTHCAGMCGPFVMAQLAGQENGQATGLKRLVGAALLPYHLGRMTTYVGLGIIFNIFFHALPAAPMRTALSSALLLTAAIVFLSIAIPRLGIVFPWTARLRLPAPSKLITRVSAPLVNRHHYLLGVALGFLPCGLVTAALLAASTAANPVNAAFGMTAFAAGTFPALLMVGFSGEAAKARWPRAAQLAGVSAMVFSSLSLIGIAGTMIF